MIRTIRRRRKTHEYACTCTKMQSATSWLDSTDAKTASLLRLYPGRCLYVKLSATMSSSGARADEEEHREEEEEHREEEEEVRWRRTRLRGMGLTATA